MEFTIMLMILEVVWSVRAVDYEPPIPTLQALCPRGLHIWIPDSPEIHFVGFHVNVNTPLIGATPSEYSGDMGRPSMGRWQFDLPDVNLQKGDKVYYWMHLIHNGISILKTDLSWNVNEIPCTDFNHTHYQCKSSLSRTPKGSVCSGQLLFDEEFNNFNLDTWRHEITASGGKHNEFQIFVNNRSNSFVREGVLHLHPTLTEDVLGKGFLYNGVLDLRAGSCTNPSNNGCYKQAVGAQIINPIMSACVQTMESFSFQYGTVKIRAKMPQGDWLRPSLLLLPLRNSYGEWPRSGQIVMGESRGNVGYSVDGEPLGSSRIETSLIFGLGHSCIENHAYSENNTTWASSFHEYQLEWAPDHIQFSVDNRVIMNAIPPTGGFQMKEVSNSSEVNVHNYESGVAPFDQQFYLAISLAVGGVSDFFPDNLKNMSHPKPWNNTSPSAMINFWERKSEWYTSWEDNADLQIDYVRVWALP